MSKSGLAEFTRRNWVEAKHILENRATLNELVQDLPPDPSKLASGSASSLASGSASAPEDVWTFIKDIFQRHRGEVREKHGRWLPETSSPFANIPFEEEGLWHPQFAIEPWQAIALASGSDPATTCQGATGGPLNLVVSLDPEQDCGPQSCHPSRSWPLPAKAKSRSTI